MKIRYFLTGNSSSSNYVITVGGNIFGDNFLKIIQVYGKHLFNEICIKI
jgi:hypothetical protein